MRAAHDVLVIWCMICVQRDVVFLALICIFVLHGKFDVHRRPG